MMHQLSTNIEINVRFHALCIYSITLPKLVDVGKELVVGVALGRVEYGMADQ